MLYNEMAIKHTFGGRSQKITPEFMSATKLKILAQKIYFCFTFEKKNYGKVEKFTRIFFHGFQLHGEVPS